MLALDETLDYDISKVSKNLYAYSNLHPHYLHAHHIGILIQIFKMHTYLHEKISNDKNDIRVLFECLFCISE